MYLILIQILSNVSSPTFQKYVEVAKYVTSIITVTNRIKCLTNGRVLLSKTIIAQ